MSGSNRRIDDPIAIIGIGCRLPGSANTPEQLWKNLIEKKDCISEIPSERWNKELFYHPNQKAIRKAYSKWGGFIEDVDKFDPGAFGITPREAHQIDPQQRLVLEVSHDAFLDAGYEPEDFRNRNIGVFVGISTFDYAFQNLNVLNLDDIDTYYSTGTSLGIAANRVSYCFDFKGPSFIVDTACSSSLMSVHLASQSIWRGDSSMALAGGVNLILGPNIMIAFSKMGLLSPHGRCKAFSEDALGFVRSEGAGMLLLKPLRQAKRDNDRIYAIIRATGTNQDGRTNGIAVPNEQSQIELYKSVYNRVGIDPKSIDYVEAHGTGTLVGDYIETNSLGTVLGKASRRKNDLLIGSVKTNIGHLESGSGVAGIIKAALVLKNRAIPPNLHFEHPSSRIEFDLFGIKVVDEFTEVPGMKFAAVNSFGFGGANVHIVLERPGRKKQRKARMPEKNLLLVLSADSEERLKILCQNYIDFLEQTEESEYNIARSCTQNRKHRLFRLCAVGKNKMDWIASLSDFLKGKEQDGSFIYGLANEKFLGPVFVFSGQGPQWYAMGRGLYHSDRIFRNTVKRCDRYIVKMAGWSVIEEIHRDEELSKIQDTAIAQPIITVFQIALARVLKYYGIIPAAVIGHSIGEIAAGYVAGAYDLRTAIKIIVTRGALMEQYSRGGKLIAISAPDEFVQNLDSENLELAAINSPAGFTIAGTEQEIFRLEKVCKELQYYNKVLFVDHGFHSFLMDDIKEPLLEALKKVKSRKPGLPMVSTVTAKTIDDSGELTADYWWANVRKPVLFYEGIKRLAEDEYNDFLEIAPHPVLRSSMIGIFKQSSKSELNVIPTIFRESDEGRDLMIVLANLYCKGYSINWERVFGGKKVVIALPGYPWEKSRYWSEAFENRFYGSQDTVHPILGFQLPGTEISFLNFIDLIELPYLKDHRYEDMPLFPGTAYIESFVALAGFYTGIGMPIDLKNTSFERALFLRSDDSYSQIKIDLDEIESEARFYSRPENRYESWNLNSRTTILKNPESSLQVEKICVKTLLEKFETSNTGKYFYKLIQYSPLRYGDTFQCLERYWLKENEILAEIRVPDPIQKELDNYFFHPAILDICLQASFINRLYKREILSSKYTLIPKFIKKFSLFRKLRKNKIYALIQKKRDSLRSSLFDICVFEVDGNLIAKFTGVELQGMEIPAKNDGQFFDDWIYKNEWMASDEFSVGKNVKNHVSYSITQEGKWEEICQDIEQSGKLLNEIAKYELADLMKDLDQNATIQNSVNKNEVLKTLRANAEVKISEMISSVDVLEESGNMKNSNKTQSSLTNNSNHSRTVKELLRKSPERIIDLVPILNKKTNFLSKIQDKPSVDPDKQWIDALESFSLYSFIFRSFYQKTREILSEFFDTKKIFNELSILELNGKFGGITDIILEIFRDKNPHYLFTEPDHFILSNTRQRIGMNKSIDYSALDPSNITEENDSLSGKTFDLIIASDLCFRYRPESGNKLLEELSKLLNSDGNLILIDKAELPFWTKFILFDQDGQFLMDRSETVQANSNFSEFLDSISESFEYIGPNMKELTSDEHSILILKKKCNMEEVVEDKMDIEGNDTPDVTDLKTSAIIIAEYGEMSQEVMEILKLHYSKLVFNTLEEFISTSDDLEMQGDTMDIIAFFTGYESGSASADEDIVGYWYKLVRFIQRIANSEIYKDIRFFGFTRGILPVNRIDTKQLNYQLSVFRGLYHSFLCEYPEAKCKLIDLDPDLTVEQNIQYMLDELFNESLENEISYKGGQRYVARLQKKSILFPDDEIPNPRQYELIIGESNTIKALKYVSKPEKTLTADEIEIEIRATAVNFRDLLKILGVYPKDSDDYLQLGDEFSGIVSRIGAKVDRFSPSDKVICIGSPSFASHAIVQQHQVFKKPEKLSFEEASGIPVVFLTAHYALIDLANIQEGEYVLIHAAAGGVGLAAIQVALSRKARIIATASPAKQTVLKALGVKHIFNSRDGHFAEEIMSLTENRGVDVILNSLSGEFQESSMELLAPFGRFLEIGKRDIYENRKTGLYKFKNNNAIYFVDLSTVFKDRSGKLLKLAKDVFDNFETGSYHPLPLRIFPPDKIKDAFRIISKGGHIGKLVIRFGTRNFPVYPCSNIQWESLQGEKTIVLTGATSGFGAEISNYLIHSGAQNIAMFSRSELTREKILQILNRESLPADVRVESYQLDVSDPDQVNEAFQNIKLNMPEVTGIIHCAAIYNDQLIQHIDFDSFEQVIAPKAMGMKNLYQQSKALKLDFFMTISSVVAVLGNLGQCSYAMANSFVEGFTEWMRKAGIPATSIHFGPLKNTGYLERNKEIGKQLNKNGLELLNIHHAIQVLDTVRNNGQSGLLAFRANLKMWTESLGMKTISPKIKEMYDASEKKYQKDTSRSLKLERILEAEGEERIEMITEYIKSISAKIIGIDPENIHEDGSFQNLGLDSLMALEMQYEIENTFGIHISPVEVAKDPTIPGFAHLISKLIDDKYDHAN